MPRVNRVKKCRKSPGSCSRCNATIETGQPYVWWKFAYGAKHVRCAKPECYPRPSELTQSDKLARIYGAAENRDDVLVAFREEGDLDNLTSELQNIAGELQEVADEYRESADAIRENFENSPTADECEEKADHVENIVGELESFSPDEFEYDADDERDEDEQRSDWIEEVAAELEGIDIDAP